MPVEEIVFDLGTLRVMTDMALTGVALEVGPWGGGACGVR